MQQPPREIRIQNDPRVESLPDPAVRRAVSVVLDGEGAGPAEISISFFSGQHMRGLNRRTFGEDRATDVIAFSLPHPGRIVGDIYVCPSFARRAAYLLDVRPQEELLRLVVHGTLHVLGYEHPEGEERLVSLMWRVQERYVHQLLQRQR